MSIDVRPLGVDADGQERAGPGAWHVMEARLGTAKSHDLLRAAAQCLDRLSGEVELCDTTARDVAEASEAVGTALRAVTNARRALA